MAFSFPTPAIVSIVARPDASSAWIRLVGDLDLAAEPALAVAVDRLNVRPLRFIVIDLTAVTFACSTLVNFLVALHRAHPDADLVLHNPTRMTRVILTLTGVDGYVTMSGRPLNSTIRRQPGDWPAIDRQPGRTRDFGSSQIVG